jgi:hypothetical protein
MRSVRFWVALSFGLAFVVGTGLLTPAAPFELGTIHIKPGTAEQPISLRDRLVVGLQARLKSEIGFCNTVAIKVQMGKLPQRVVDQTFFWARERASASRNGLQTRPIIYFQPAMKLRAEKLHVVL